MKYLVSVIFLASCAMTPAPVEDDVPEQPAPVVRPGIPPEQPEGRPETRKPKLKLPPTPPPSSEVSSCAKLDAGDLKETIKAKLDCIKENTK